MGGNTRKSIRGGDSDAARINQNPPYFMVYLRFKGTALLILRSPALMSNRCNFTANLTISLCEINSSVSAVNCFFHIKF